MKNNRFIIIFFFLFATLSHSYAAVKIVECEDENGNRSFQKMCPPGTSVVGEKKIRIGSDSSDSISNNEAPNIQATLYMVNECDACDQVRDLLSGKGVSFTEKDVSEDVELQKELTELSGTLKVPTTVLGESILTGYNHGEFINALKEAGYNETTDVSAEETEEVEEEEES